MFQVPLAGHYGVLSHTPEPMTSTLPGMQRGMHPGKTRTDRVPWGVLPGSTGQTPQTQVPAEPKAHSGHRDRGTTEDMPALRGNSEMPHLPHR